MRGDDADGSGVAGAPSVSPAACTSADDASPTRTMRQAALLTVRRASVVVGILLVACGGRVAEQTSADAAIPGETAADGLSTDAIDCSGLLAHEGRVRDSRSR
jgi:hypothetical protein